MKPEISIIIPVYNTGKYIEKTLQSIINQTYKNFEVVIVDDETPDNAIEIAEKILSENNINFKIIRQKNQGQGVSRNVGVNNSIGDWIFFLDSDDVIQKDTLELMKNSIGSTKDKIDFVFSAFQNVKLGEEFKGGGEYLGMEFFQRQEIQDAFLERTQIILVPGTLFNKEWYLQNGLSFKKIPYSEDQLFIWEILLNTNRAIKINKYLYNYLSRPGSIMTASKFEQIVLGYPHFKEIEEKYRKQKLVSPVVSKFLVSRWVFGILHSAAKLCTVEEYAKLLDVFESKEHYKNLVSFPDFKIRILAFFCVIFPSFGYFVNKNL